MQTTTSDRPDGQIDRYGFVVDPDATCCWCGQGHDPAEQGFIFHQYIIGRLIAKHDFQLDSPGHLHFDCFVAYASSRQIDVTKD